jgi:ribonuclease P protein component
MRILRRSDFVDIQGTGRKVHGRYLVAMVKPSKCNLSTTSTDQQSMVGRVGFTITKKIGNAVVRNRVRRVVREWLRTHGWVGHGRDVVFVAKPSVGALLRSPSALIRDLEKLASQL